MKHLSKREVFSVCLLREDSAFLCQTNWHSDTDDDRFTVQSGYIKGLLMLCKYFLVKYAGRSCSKHLWNLFYLGLPYV